jgi:hypothetical protein
VRLVEAVVAEVRAKRAEQERKQQEAAEKRGR